MSYRYNSPENAALVGVIAVTGAGMMFAMQEQFVWGAEPFDATITGFHTRHSSRHSTTVVEYTYDRGGKSYHRESDGSLPFVGVGSHVTVYVDPDDPSYEVLGTFLQRNFQWLATGVVVLVVGGGGLAF